MHHSRFHDNSCFLDTQPYSNPIFLYTSLYPLYSTVRTTIFPAAHLWIGHHAAPGVTRTHQSTHETARRAQGLCRCASSTQRRAHYPPVPSLSFCTHHVVVARVPDGGRDGGDDDPAACDALQRLQLRNVGTNIRHGFSSVSRLFRIQYRGGGKVPAPPHRYHHP